MEVEMRASQLFMDAALVGSYIALVTALVGALVYVVAPLLRIDRRGVASLASECMCYISASILACIFIAVVST
jgi:hypothetical protein